MNDSTVVVSNEAEFERWLIAALQYERRRLFEVPQRDGDNSLGADESCGDCQTKPDATWVHVSS